MAGRTGEAGCRTKPSPRRMGDGDVTAAVRHQRSEGAILLSMGPLGVRRMREAHAAKVRIPHGSHEAILINTGGGLAGGDRFSFTITAEENARLTVTSQAAERVYRSLGPAADVEVTLAAHAGATLMWLPQETILFDGAALTRRIPPTSPRMRASSRSNPSSSGGRRWARRCAMRACMTAGASAAMAASSSPTISPSTARRRQAPPRWAMAAPSPPSCWSRPRPRTCSTRCGTPSAPGAMPAPGLASWLQGLLARDGFELRKSLIPALTLLADGAASA